LEASLGEEVEIKLYKPLEGTKDKELSGILTGYDKSHINVDIGGTDTELDRSAIAQIRLALDF
jgi:ribosome maturation factor RimP